MLLVLTVLPAWIEAELPLEVHAVGGHEEFVRLDVLSLKVDKKLLVYLYLYLLE